MLATQQQAASSQRLAQARFLVRERRLHEARSAYAEVVLRERHDALLWLEYGTLLAQLEDHRAALVAFDQALGLRCELAVVWNDRGVSLVALHRAPEARESFEQALRLRRRFAPASANLANLALQAGDAQAAIIHYQAALERDPKHVVARIGLGRSLALAGRSGEAGQAFEQARRQAPMTFEALLAHVAFLASQGRLVEATASCQRFLRVLPQHSGALGLHAELLREQGDEAAQELLSFERWVEVHDFAFEEAFNRELVAHVQQAPSLLHAPPQHATRSGLHSGALSGLEHPALAHLEMVIEARIADYARTRADEPTWERLRPSAVALELWAVLLEGSGFQVPHLHPAAWLSGVYYAAVPEPVDAPASQRAGYLELGRVDPELGLRVERVSRFVEPKPGRLVLFPSWLYHSTVPHAAPGLRVSIAFDCVRI